jgi:Methyltransferase domain
MTGSSSNSNSADENLMRLEEYKDILLRTFPFLSKSYVDYHSISDVDAITLERFLDRFPDGIVMLEVGTFVGVSTFHLANQSKVSKVISVDLNPRFAEVEAWEGYLSADLDTGAASDLRVQDVAEKVLTHFPEHRQIVQLIAGMANSVDIPVPPGRPFVAFVDGDHTKEGVEADLRVIFERNPHAVVVLHDCRSGWTTQVVAGVAAWVDAAPSAYRFRLFAPLDSHPSRANLGVLYPEAMAEQVERIAVGLLTDPTSEWLRRWLQVVRQATRMKRLQEAASSLESQVSDRDQRIQGLEEQLRDRDRKLRGIKEKRRRLRRRSVKLRYELRTMQASWPQRLVGVLRRIKAKALGLWRK